MPNYYSMRMTAGGVFGGASLIFATRICRAPLFAVLILSVLLAGCSSEETTSQLGVSIVTFPNGKKITAEAMRTDLELLRGMMFRDSLERDRGMLFTHPDENIYHYWMYKTKMPLDIIWMDHDHRIVEMSLKTPPCTASSPKDCTNYGGNFKSRYALEVNAGVAEANKLQVGDVLQF
jgi:uncharacterized protein